MTRRGGGPVGVGVMGLKEFGEGILNNTGPHPFNRARQDTLRKGVPLAITPGSNVARMRRACSAPGLRLASDGGAAE